MWIGFDYGSANCAVGIMQEGKISQIPLSANSQYLPSTLYALDRELIAQAVYQGISQDKKSDYAKLRSSQLSRAVQVRHELDLNADEQTVFVGQAAIDAYLEMPEDGFYVRSPKSFLGANGLREEQVALFEDIVTLMMLHVKGITDNYLADNGLAPATHAVIGRPVNFQSTGGEKSNQQAEAILTQAAMRAGFTQVAFLFEPVAAGMDFEASLEHNSTVLVVDVGGGTTDCSVVRMGPSYIANKQREQDCLGHSGQRVGGNDLDIALAMKGFMPSLGLDSLLKTGKPMPSAPFWQAVAVNDISAQREFASLGARKLLDSMIKDAEAPELVIRLKKVQQEQLSYKLVRQAETAKVALSDANQTQCQLDFIATGLSVGLTQGQFSEFITEPLAKIEALMQIAVAKAAVSPDTVYVTGGTARSPAIYAKIASVYPEANIVVGDHFGSVTAGLTRWTQQAF
ncbi:molecular chaperone [Shewanella sp. SR44-3]|uniref:molecular chaperone n=1 Tax=unclassified Shewanella TaxID=196818 RepID=UPI0015FB9C89|nr:molecular chaperone [Shewanella sp. SR44-3]MBB1270355.1 molecular chaperone [Shewanella sp. SR44-3]